MTFSLAKHIRASVLITLSKGKDLGGIKNFFSTNNKNSVLNLKFKHKVPLESSLLEKSLRISTTFGYLLRGNYFHITIKY